jgi:peptidoglycan/LPS O-acetylase OafA/YrhL
VVLSWRVYLALSSDFRVERTYYATDTRIDSILFGCLLAVARSRLAGVLTISRKVAYLFLLIGVIGLLASIVIRSELFRETARYTLQGLALLPIFYSILNRQAGTIHAILNAKWLDRIGEYSYSLYLVHYVIAQLVIFHVGVDMPRVIILVMVIFLSLCYCKVMHIYVETWTEKIRRSLRDNGGVGCPNTGSYTTSSLRP